MSAWKTRSAPQVMERHQDTWLLLFTCMGKVTLQALTKVTFI